MTGSSCAGVIAAFLTPSIAASISKNIPEGALLLARDWGEFDSYLANPNVKLGLVDPAAEGVMNLAAATRILNRRGPVPILAYVDLRNEELKAIAVLARHGLTKALLHPSRDNGAQLLEIARHSSAQRFAYAFLGLLETRLAQLGPDLFRAIQDLFERPQRYETATDIGREGGLSTKHVYRAIRKAQLGTPKKLVTAAKVVRGYSYLRDNDDLIRSVSKCLGYSRPRVFSEQITDIFGYPPSGLRRNLDATDVLINLMEWLYKPTHPSAKRVANHM